MKNVLKEFPDGDKLMEMFPQIEVLQVNAHMHTPYSFSAFTEIKQIFDMASRENISVAGINDFYVADGYEEFCSEAIRNGVFPLFNVESIGLLKEEQKNGIRINDPDNPGRCYISGKGLDYPFNLGFLAQRKLNKLIRKNQEQVKSMINLANDWFSKLNIGIRLSYSEIQRNLAKNLVRERHIARAIRIAIYEKYKEDEKRFEILSLIFSGKQPKTVMNDYSGIENEIRSNLLKSGGVAFVKEEESAFMELEKINKIIVNAGGIPCYPVLLDDKNGNYTEFEKDFEKMYQELKRRNISCVELIPGRNESKELERFVKFFNGKGFVIMFGTEHNTPDLIPLTCNTRDKQPLSFEMQKISYKGCCVIAAHQYLRAKGLKGYVDSNGVTKTELKEYFVTLGNCVIHYFINKYKVNH